MNQCYICESMAIKKCSTCGSNCCEIHFENIHDPCKIGNEEKLQRTSLLGIKDKYDDELCSLS